MERGCAGRRARVETAACRKPTPAPAAARPAQEGTERDVDAWLRRRFEGRIRDIVVVDKEDLDLVCFLVVGALGCDGGESLWRVSCGYSMQGARGVECSALTRLALPLLPPAPARERRRTTCLASSAACSASTSGTCSTSWRWGAEALGQQGRGQPQQV
jgi:hypothetical protein